MTSARRMLESKGSTAKVMWALAASPYPLTVRQCADMLNYDSTLRTHRSAVSQALSRLHENGMVIRRQVPGTGAPYEYTINPDWEPPEVVE